MDLGLFMMPLHRPEKPWRQALAEDREAVVLADRLGFAEVWVGEHFSTKVEQIPSPLMFFASLVECRAAAERLVSGLVESGPAQRLVTLPLLQRPPSTRYLS